MTEMDTPISLPEPKNRSTGALILFLFLALPMPFCMLSYHYFLWYLEQSAIASGRLANLAWAGPIGLALQGILLAGIFTALWRLTKDERFKPVYAGWLGAALMAFPALVLRFLGPNNDQLGSILQILICGIAAVIVARIRKTRVDWKSNNVWLAFFLAAFGAAPFAIFGALGSPTDTILSLLAGLSLGLLAALLMESTTGNRFLDAFGIGTVLALLGSAIGYDGAQLILLAILPSFAFAIASLMPSRVSAAILAGLLAAAGLIFFDPTELTIVLGDIFPIAARAVAFSVGLGLAIGLIALIARHITRAGDGSSVTRAFGWLGAFAAWVVVIMLYFTTGNRGFYGDRLFVILKDQANLSDLTQIQDIDQRRTAAYQTLTAHANQTQAGLRNAFDRISVDYTPYYLVNAMEVRGGTLVRLFLSTRPEGDRVIPSPRLRPAPHVATSAISISGNGSTPSGVQWNVAIIGADRVWSEFGVRGKGIVVGQSDSGVDVNHPELQ